MRALALGLPGAGGQANPFQLAGQGLLPGRGRLLFAHQALLLLFEPGGVVALPGNTAAAVELQNPAGHIVEKIPVVRHGHHRAGILRQMPFEPGNAFGVEVICRLIQQEQVGLFQQHFAQRHASPLAARERRHVGVAGRKLHGVHRDLDLPV